MGKKTKEKSKIVDEKGVFVCPNCGLKDIETNFKKHTFTYGKGKGQIKLSVQIPIKTCVSCKFSFRDFIADDICHEELCKHLGVMTPRQIKGLRKLYNLTQAEFAKITKLGEATLSRWERGVLIQNEAYDNYMYLLGFDGNLAKLRDRSVKIETHTDNIVKVNAENKLTRDIPNGSPSFSIPLGT
jgi:putative zinc finger/helix-turn-helix YgiT family protein